MSDVQTDIVYDIYDNGFDEKMIVRETPGEPGLISLQYDFQEEGKFRHVFFTPDQAEHVASALLATAKLIKVRELADKTKDVP